VREIFGVERAVFLKLADGADDADGADGKTNPIG
jgi:hypothetical protein